MEVSPERAVGSGCGTYVAGLPALHHRSGRCYGAMEVCRTGKSMLEGETERGACLLIRGEADLAAKYFFTEELHRIGA